MDFRRRCITYAFQTSGKSPLSENQVNIFCVFVLITSLHVVKKLLIYWNGYEVYESYVSEFDWKPFEFVNVAYRSAWISRFDELESFLFIKIEMATGFFQLDSL